MNNNRVYPNNSNVVTFKPRAIRGLLCHSLMINASIHHFIVISLAILFFGNVVFTATAMAGSLTATAAVTVVDIPPPQGNLALGAPAVASSAERLDTLAENAVDGDASSRWSSLFSDPQWIYVDLSAIYTIDRVVLNWETAYGKAYEIQVSRNTHNWVTVFTESNSDGGIDDLTFAAVNARYVRVMGLQRSTRYGYSMLEFEVYGVSALSELPVLTSLSIEPAVMTVTDGSTQEFMAIALDQYGEVLPTQVNWSVDGGGAIDGDGIFTASAVGGAFSVTATTGILTATAVVTVKDIPPPADNLALGAPVVASSEESHDTKAVNAVDGDPSSRWSSKFSDPQWIYVDLSEIVTIDRVVLNWETAYGKAYEIQVSYDAQNWVTAFAEGNGDGGIDDITFAAVNARYVRVMGLRRDTRYGYSLLEIEVYETSTPSDPPVLTSLSVSPAAVIVTDGATQGFTATALDQYGKVLPTPVSWLVDGGGMIDENGVFTATAVGGPFTVTATAMEDILPSPAGNLALGAPVVASSAERPGTLAENAVDGDPSSRWSSKFSDPQWIYVDLSAIFTIDRVVLNWEAAYGKAYEIQVSNDAQNWVIVFTEGDSDGGIDDLTFAAPVNARYVRVMGLQRSTRYGYSLMEFEVYGAGTLPTPCLPYDKPSVESLRSSKKKVFAHYFSPYPLSLDNLSVENDYYTQNYLNPEGEGGKFAYCGGLLRDRTLPPEPYASGIDWAVENMKIEVRRAIAIGLDGFIFDVLSTSDSNIHMRNLKHLLEAAKDVDPEFLIQLMPDMDSGDFSGSGSSSLTHFIALLDAVGDHPSIHKLSDGHVILTPFRSEAKDADFWNWLLTRLDRKGYNVALMTLTLGSVRNNWKFNDVPRFGVSSWGSRSLSNAAATLIHDTGYAKDHNLLWMAPVAPQDSRPRHLSFAETVNSASFRAQWDAVISGDADWVQLVTWNDYSENTHVAPSAETGTAFYDLSGYYTTWFKTGVQPKIQRDALYYFHRAHSLDSSVAPPDLSLQREPFKGESGPTEATNEIELVALLTAPGMLEITIGGITHRKEVLSGLQSFRVPLNQGTPVFRLTRGGQTIVEFQSQTPINNTIDYQDPLYHAGSSLSCDVIR